MRYIEAPFEYQGKEPSLFIAGGISGCPDWQEELVESLSDLPITIYNPRRKNMVLDPALLREQILWEFNKLEQATAISFWFPKETLCPITLFELGAHTRTNKKLFVGTHQEYKRKEDVILQTGLVRPDIKVIHSIDLLAQQIRSWNSIK